MYNPNNIVIGAALIFLVAYSFFIIRRMYKRRIHILEMRNLEVAEDLEKRTEMLRTLSHNIRIIQNTDDVPDGMVMNQVAVTHDQEVTEPLDIDASAVEEKTPNPTPNVVEEIKKTEDIKELSALEPIVETKEELTENLETTSVEPPTNNDNISSMTVAQLRLKLNELGQTIPKGMKKKEMQAMILAIN